MRQATSTTAIHDLYWYKCQRLLLCRVLVNPEQLQFVANKRTVCQNDVVSFTCSAVGNPVVHIYLLYENDTLVSNNSAGVWSRRLSAGGVFIYTCVTNNTVGTAESKSLSITVNGKQSDLLNTSYHFRRRTSL